VGDEELTSFPEDIGDGSGNTSAETYSEICERLCPYYMAYGMSPTEYWDGEPGLARQYREAYEIKRSMRNQELWLQGLYIYEALLDVSPILHAFPKQGTKPKEYPKEPYPITPKDQEEKERREQMANMMKIKRMVDSWLKGDETDGR